MGGGGGGNLTHECIHVVPLHSLPPKSPTPVPLTACSISPPICQVGTNSESLEKQYEVVKKETTTSHVMQYGELVSC